MATVFGIFSGELDANNDFRKVVLVPTGKTRITARKFRVKLLKPHGKPLDGRVSAEVRGAAGAIMRVVYSDFEDLWNKRKVPKLPKKFIPGKVAAADVQLNDCFPEYEVCNGHEAVYLGIAPAVPSIDFLVEILLSIPKLPAGTSIRGMIALSEA